MVHTSEMDFSGMIPVDGYGPGFFRVGGVVHQGPLALLPDGPQPWAGIGDMTLFLERAETFDILLVGTGTTFEILAPEMRVRLESAGIGVETMTTGAACRSYNVLLAEARRVAAALVPI